MATPNPSKQRVITLTDAAPVRIRDEDWPLVSEGSWHNDVQFCDATRTCWIKVRRHADGRVIVYGGFNSSWENERAYRGGVLLGPTEDVVDAIRRVALDSHAEQCVAETIAGLPPIEL